MADVDSSLYQWSTTESSNKPTGATTIGSGLDDNLRQIQATTRAWLASKGADIASATTTDLGAVAGLAHDITGTTTITSFGTVAAGIWKILKFEGALTLTHNATSLILPGGENITTADGDVAVFISEGSGNWRCVSYVPVAINPAKIVSTDETQTLTNKTLTAAILAGTTDVSGGQLKFPASQSASSDANTLDDYEEGTWTPVLSGASTAGTYEAGSNWFGTYTKVGRLVTLNAYMTLSGSITGGGTGLAKITGLPFAKSGSQFSCGACYTSGVDLTGACSLAIGWNSVNSDSTLLLYETTDNGAVSNTPISGFGNSDVLAFSISYNV